MKWLLCISTVCWSCPEKNHTFTHASHFPIVRMSPFSPYAWVSNHHWKGKKCPSVCLNSAANAILPLEVRIVHGLRMESKVIVFWMDNMIVQDSCVRNGVLNVQKTLGSVSFWKEKKETGFLNGGWGTNPKEGAGCGWIKWVGRSCIGRCICRKRGNGMRIWIWVLESHVFVWNREMS